MAYSSPHTAARLRCGDRRLDAWTQGQKKNVISSGSGSLRALEASGGVSGFQRPRRHPRRRCSRDSRGGVATQFCNLAAAPETRRATAFAPGGIPLYKLSLTQPLIVLAPVPARLAVALRPYGVVQRRRRQEGHERVGVSLDPPGQLEAAAAALRLGHDEQIGAGRVDDV